MDIPKMAAEYGLSTDEVRARYLSLKAAKWKADFHLFCHDIIRIRAKDGELTRLVLNEAQHILHNAAETMLNETGWVRLMGLKGRRQGFSTYVAARGYWRATLWDRQNIYILSHEQKSTDALFAMVALIQEKNPFPPKVGTDNAKQLEFNVRGSSYAVATAGQKAGGRGTAVSYFHGSEAAWWTNAADHFSSSVQSVDEVRGKRGVLWRKPANPLPFEAVEPDVIEGWIKAPSEIWLETTSSGPSGIFYQKYMDAMKGKGRYRNVFVPWTVQNEYEEAGYFIPETENDEEGELSEAEYQELYGLSNEKMLWRRSKLQELHSPAKFRQEYPIDVTEAFAAAETDGLFISPKSVLKARKRPMADPDAPLIIGIDPAGSGGDKFAVVWRRGDKVLKVKTRPKIDHLEAVAWVSRIIDEDRPSQVNIDNGNIGGPLITTLRAQSRRYAEVVRAINFGGTSRAKLANKKKAGPVNRRAEIWGLMKEWLKEGSIPDHDDLASEISSLKEKFRPNNDWLLESKVEAKERGVSSPDIADALALTFASPEFFATWSKPKTDAGFAAGQLRRVDASGIGDHDGFYEADISVSDHGWMG